MKKFIFSLAVLAMSAFGAMAQTTECASKGTCPEGQAQCDKAKKSCDGKEKFNPFEGITLSAEQQVKIDALKAKCAAEKAEKSLDKDKVKGEEKGKKMLEEVKSILTPEQYTKFLENNFLSKGKHGGKGHGDKACKGEVKKCDKDKACKSELKKDGKKDDKSCCDKKDKKDKSDKK